MTVGLNKADILHFFDQWSTQSEQNGELSKELRIMGHCGRTGSVKNRRQEPHEPLEVD